MDLDKSISIRARLKWVQIGLFGALLWTIILNPESAFRIIQVLGSLMGFLIGLSFKDDFTQQGLSRSKAWAVSLGFGIFFAIVFQGLALFAYNLGQ